MSQEPSKSKPSKFKAIYSLLLRHNLIVNAVDNGHAWQKLVFLDSDGNLVCRKYESIVGDGTNSLMDIKNEFVDTYMVGGEKFVCNIDVKRPLETRREGYQTSKENKALVAHSLFQSNLLGDRRIILGTTLPLKRYYLNGKKNVDLCDTVQELFLKTKTERILDDNGKVAAVMEVGAHTCLPESYLAYYDWAYSDEGEINPKCYSSHGPILVIDIGGGTTDIGTILGGTGLSIDFSRSDTIQVGIIDCYRSIWELFVNKVKQIDPKIGVHLADAIDLKITYRLLKESVITVNGIKGAIDMTDEVAQVKKEFVARIAEKTLDIIGNITRYETILIVGGGAVVLQDLLEESFPGAVFLNEFSNAKGLLKVMLILELKNLMAMAQEAVTENG